MSLVFDHNGRRFSSHECHFVTSLAYVVGSYLPVSFMSFLLNRQVFCCGFVD